MLHAFVFNVSSVFSDTCCKCGYLDIAYVFTHMLQVFYLNVPYVCNDFQVFLHYFCKCFRGMFQVFHLPLYLYFKCWSRWFKSISSVAILQRDPSCAVTAGASPSGYRRRRRVSGRRRRRPGSTNPCGRAKRRRGRGVLARSGVWWRRGRVQASAGTKCISCRGKSRRHTVGSTPNPIRLPCTIDDRSASAHGLVSYYTRVVSS
jgi:hypothetical protein